TEITEKRRRWIEARNLRDSMLKSALLGVLCVSVVNSSSSRPRRTPPRRITRRERLGRCLLDRVRRCPGLIGHVGGLRLVARRRLVAPPRPRGLAVRRWDLPRLHQLLEAAEVLFHLLLRRFAEHLRDR